MEYKYRGRRKKPHHFVFFGEETEAAKAAFTEVYPEIDELEPTEEDFKSVERVVIDPKNRKKVYLDLEDPALLLKALRRFNEKTEEQMDVIEDLPIPDFRNRDIAIRRIIGEAAAQLTFKVIVKLGYDPEVEKFKDQLNKGLPEV